MSEDTRLFDGPFDKRAIRNENREVADLLRSDLHVRVPGGEKTYGTMKEVENGPTDRGRRWTHTYEPPGGRFPGGEEPLPVSFDAGAKALYASPIGWRVLYGYVKDDPTYGFEVTVFDPTGRVYAQTSGIEHLYGWLDTEGNLP